MSEPKPKRSFVKRTVFMLMVLIAAAAAGVGGSLAAPTLKEMYDKSHLFVRPTTAKGDICADTPSAVAGRSALVITKTDFLASKVEQESESGTRWCVFGTSDGNHDLWWVAVNAGTSNGIYRALTADRRDGEDGAPATLTYAGLPPIQFARDGWIAFITPSEDTWTAFHAGAGARLLAELVDAAG